MDRSQYEALKAKLQEYLNHEMIRMRGVWWDPFGKRRALDLAVANIADHHASPRVLAESIEGYAYQNRKKFWGTPDSFLRLNENQYKFERKVLSFWLAQMKAPVDMRA